MRKRLVLILVMLLCGLPALAGDYATVEWTDLMPKEDLDALLNPPPELASIPDGSPEDALSNEVARAVGQANSSRYQQALTSTRVKPEFNGRNIRIAGFVVPLQFDDNQVVTEFFFVPYFGACIHVPPPPPNQMMFVTYKPGLKLKELYDPFWIEGRLETKLVTQEIGTAAYTLQAERIEPYTEQ